MSILVLIRYMLKSKVIKMFTEPLWHGRVSLRVNITQ
jgi:hypothetical protein